MTTITVSEPRYRCPVCKVEQTTDFVISASSNPKNVIKGCGNCFVKHLKRLIGKLPQMEEIK